MGWRQVAIVSPLVIIQGTSPDSGLFVYNGIGAPGNPPVFSVVAPGVSTDPFGNTVGSVLDVGTFGGPGLNVDQFGNLSIAGADGSLIELAPAANTPVVVQALNGIIQAVMAIRAFDSLAVNEGIVSGIVLGGTSNKPGLLITSPFASEGMGLLLQAQNDAGTDVPWCTWGTVVTQGGTLFSGGSLVFTPVMAFTPQALIMYASGGTITVVTRTTSGTISGLPATVLAEAWGTGGSTSGESGGVSAIGGSGGGEYAAEPALATTGTVTVTIPVSGSGSNTTVVGSAATVTAHPGQPGTVATFGAGGTGSANTTHHDGARGGNPSFADPGGGGGGGGSGGTLAAGNHGAGGGPTAGGAGGLAVSGGGAGGRGGNPTGNGVVGSLPGGGGGGGSTNASGAIGGGGQARVTYSSGAPAIMFSVAAAAGTDQFGTSYPAGPSFTSEGRIGAALGPATTGTVTVTGTGQNNIATGTIPAGDASAAGAAYELHCFGSGVTGSTQELLVFSAAIGGTQLGTAQGPAAASMAVSLTFTWHAVARLIVRSVGTGGTCIGGVQGSLTVVPGPNVIPGTPADFTVPFDAFGGSSAAMNTTIANTFAIRCGWGAVTGAPTITSQGSYLVRVA